MRKFVIIIVVAAMIVLCPDQESHQKAINQRFSENVTELIKDTDAASLLGFWSAAFGVDYNRMLRIQEYDNWVFFSTGSCVGAKTIGVLGMVFIIGDGDTSVSRDNPSAAARHENAGSREYIRKFIAEQNACRLVAITSTKSGGDVAISGDNGYACTTACPSELKKALKEINDSGRKITDVCLTDKGKYVVLFGRNGYYSNGLPQDMRNRLAEFYDANEALCSATVNDNGDWVVISDKHFSASSSDIQNWLRDWSNKYGNLISVSITDDAQVAIFERGYAWRGNLPKELKERIGKTGYPIRTIRMAGKSWFLADETGTRYYYSM